MHGLPNLKIILTVFNWILQQETERLFEYRLPTLKVARRWKPLRIEYTSLDTGYTVQFDRRDILKLKNSGLAFFLGVRDQPIKAEGRARIPGKQRNEVHCGWLGSAV